MIKVVIFDLDDTLTSELEFIKSGFNVVSEDISLEHDLDKNECYLKMIELFNLNSNNVFNRILDFYNISYKQKDVYRLVDIYRNHIPEIRLYDDVMPTIKKLKEKNIKLGIITDGYKETQNNKIKVLELNRYMDKIIVTDELGRDFWKPHPKSYKIMKDYFNVKYEEMIYIGDNESKDFISPEKLGMKWLKIFRKNSIYNENSKKSDIMSLSTILDLI